MSIDYASVCWSITYECDYNCLFCHAFQNNMTLLTPNENMEILKTLISLGTKKITWTGGNPLLYNGICDLIQYAKVNGIQTALATNGVQLNEDYLTLLDDVVDCLIIPLDASNGNLQSKMGRPQRHFELIQSILKIIAENNFKYKIRINTRVKWADLRDISS